MSTVLARLIGPAPERYQRLEAALLYAFATTGYVAGEQLQQFLPGLWPGERMEAILLELAAQGTLNQLQRDPRGYLYDRYGVEPERLRLVLRVAQGIAGALAQQPPANLERYEVVATLPPGFRLQDSGRSPIPLFAALHELIVKANRTLTFLNPFFELQGLKPLFEALAAAAQRGVVITMITRDLEQSASPNRTALADLHQYLGRMGLASQLHVYNYKVQAAGRIVLTLHAKVAISDGIRAYVGSANLTSYGLERYLEIGVLLYGPQVGVIESIVSGVLQSGVASRVQWHR